MLITALYSINMLLYLYIYIYNFSSLLVLLIMSYTYGTYNRCIPYRITEDINDEDQSSSSSANIENKIQVLMVSSPDRDDRVFPKVGI